MLLLLFLFEYYNYFMFVYYALLIDNQFHV